MTNTNLRLKSNGVMLFTLEDIIGVVKRVSKKDIHFQLKFRMFKLRICLNAPSETFLMIKPIQRLNLNYFGMKS